MCKAVQTKTTFLLELYTIVDYKFYRFPCEQESFEKNRTDAQAGLTFLG